jgi:RNA polymerase sigma-70 factor (ECF subfamily)
MGVSSLSSGRFNTAPYEKRTQKAGSWTFCYALIESYDALPRPVRVFEGRQMNAASRFESTASLLADVRDGDEAARERLCALYLPILMRWAHGRLPRQARALSETADLVQSTLMQVLGQVDRFESRHEGAFLAYLRNALLNVMRNEIRRGVRHPSVNPEDFAELRDDSPLADQVGRETLIDYERALAELKPERREAAILRIEFGFSFDEIAAAMERPSADAARMLVGRALAQLAEAMR